MPCFDRLGDPAPYAPAGVDVHHNPTFFVAKNNTGVPRPFDRRSRRCAPQSSNQDRTVQPLRADDLGGASLALSPTNLASLRQCSTDTKDQQKSYHQQHLHLATLLIPCANVYSTPYARRNAEKPHAQRSGTGNPHRGAPLLFHAHITVAISRLCAAASSQPVSVHPSGRPSITLCEHTTYGLWHAS